MVTENVFGENGESGQKRSERIIDLQSVEGGYDEGKVVQIELGEVESFERRLGGPDYLGVVKKFLSLTGGSVVYCLSALSIIYGIGQIVGPGLAESYDARQTMPAVGVLNLYELCLLGALVFIVVWRKVTDDAVSLVLLIALFLVGTGLTLGTIAPTSFKPCLVVGMVCVLLGAGKLQAMRKYVSLRIGVLSFVGLMIILMWNFLGSPLMAWAFVLGEWPDEVRHSQWMFSWVVMIIGAGFVVAEGILVKDEDIAANMKGNPFIRTYSMVWVFVLVVLGAAGGHQYAVSYMFVIDWVWGDYVPLVGVIALLGIELLRSRGKGDVVKIGEAVMALVPLGVMALAMADEAVEASFVFGGEVMAYPPVLLGIVGSVICVQGVVHRNRLLQYASLGYVFGVLLTAGYDANSPYVLNWKLFGVGLIVSLVIIGFVKREPAACFAAVAVLAFGLAITDGFFSFAGRYDFNEIGALAGVLGLGSMVVSLAFGRKTPKLIMVFGALCLMVGMFDCLGSSFGVKDVITGIAVIGLCVGLWFRIRNYAVMSIIFLPFVPKLVMLPKSISSWAFVLLSFVLLFAGIAVSSFCKGSSTGEEESV